MRKRFWTGFLTGVLAMIVLGVTGTFLFLKFVRTRMAKNLEAPLLTREIKGNYDFVFSTLDGQTRHLSDLRGKIAFVNFWGTWCLPCVAEMPTVQELYNHLKEDTSIVFIIASRLDAPDKVRTFADKHHYSLPFYTIRDEDIPQQLRFNQYPATFIFARDGSLITKHITAANWSDPSVVAFIKDLERE
jgi:thiol-disulfide isomerase/thioredoxin